MSVVQGTDALSARCIAPRTYRGSPACLGLNRSAGPFGRSSRPATLDRPQSGRVRARGHRRGLLGPAVVGEGRGLAEADDFHSDLGGVTFAEFLHLVLDEMRGLPGR